MGFSGEVEYSDMSGLTNKTYKVTVQGKDMVLRLFGEEATLFLSRIQENHMVTHLGQLGYGPQVLYSSEKMRVERFLENRRVIDSEGMKMSESLVRIAEKIAEYHEIMDIYKKEG